MLLRGFMGREGVRGRSTGQWQEQRSFGEVSDVVVECISYHILVGSERLQMTSRKEEGDHRLQFLNLFTALSWGPSREWERS